MSYGAGAAAGGAAAAAAIQALRAMGVIVRVEPEQFARVLGRAEEPVVVTASGGWFSTSYSYVTTYKGLAFFTKAKEELPLPEGVELVEAEKIHMPM